MARVHIWFIDVTAGSLADSDEQIEVADIRQFNGTSLGKSDDLCGVYQFNSVSGVMYQFMTWYLIFD